jgi:hypothetical protein
VEDPVDADDVPEINGHPLRAAASACSGGC